MISLRARLFWVLLIATGLIWLSAVAWIFVSSRHEVEHVLDMRLQEAARMVDSLVPSADALSSRQTGGAIIEPASYQRQLSCQIWSLDGRLVARSESAPGGKLTDSPSGFSERIVNGEPWRVYSIEDAAKGVRVLVGDRLGLRERLVFDLIKGVLTPALLIAPLLAMLIWAALGQGLSPLRRAAAELQLREADDMRPLDLGNTPTEVRPLVAALNGLFGKVHAARQHERAITAFAAHELRTPLSGLKTQAQVALATADPAVRDKALRQIVTAVERSTRLIRQLLAISRLDATEARASGDLVNLGALVSEIVSDTPAPQAKVLVSPALADLTCRVERDSLALAVRNLHENALGHLPPGGTVSWSGVGPAMGTLRLIVEDEGPGIPPDEIGKVTDRFFRGRNKSPVGSGLGLAIVDVALRRCGAMLAMANRTDTRGLRVEIIIPVAATGVVPSGLDDPGLAAFASDVRSSSYSRSS